MPYKNYIYEYYAKISSGEIIVGKWIKKIFEIIINGLQTQEYFFNAKAANKAIKFIETFCHHSKGRNDLITLELWQKAIVSTIFGIQDAEKIRVFREIFIVIGRKNGKSLFASALIAYMAYLEPEYGQEIYCLAPKLDQAALVYDGFYQMVQAEEELEELAKKRRSDIYIAESNTVIKPIAFNAKKSDGFNPQLVVCDEMAAWSGDAGLKQYEVMKSALGARKQPMILSISTAGYINDSIYDELMKRSTSFLKGNSKERRLLPFLYMIDDVEKWNDIDELKKANPNMGVSVKESFFIDEIAVAEGSLSKVLHQKTYAAQTLAKAGIGGYAGNNNYSGKGIGTAVAKCDMNIRSVAEVKSNTVYSSIKAGTKVEVLEVLANGWYKIVWAGASCGYAYTSNTNNKYYTYTANSKNNSTSTSGSSGLKQTQKPESALCFDKTLAGAYVVTADKLHMRAGAGKTKADYGTIAEGGKVHCYGYYNKEKGTGAKWLYVACGNVTGYCHSDYLKRA